MDSNGYPTDEDLREVTRLGGLTTPFEIIEFLKEMWIYDDYIDFKNDGDIWVLQISTAGWSGHESILANIERTLFWMMYWQKSKRGGHYWFSGKVKDGKHCFNGEFNYNEEKKLHDLQKELAVYKKALGMLSDAFDYTGDSKMDESYVNQAREELKGKK